MATYLSIYRPNHFTPLAIAELRPWRGIKWLLDRIGVSESRTDLSYILEHHTDLYGYLSKVRDLNKLPRNTQGNIKADYIPTKLSNKQLVTKISSFSPDISLSPI